MGIGIDNNDIQGSAWGAAFRNKPIMLKTTAEAAAFLDGKIIKNVVLNEDCCTLSTNNSYRNHTTYEVANSGKGSAFLDLGFLIRDETSSLRGNLSDANDVDFYNFTIPFNRTLQNWFGVEIYMDLPTGCNYSLTLYDEYGNLAGNVYEYATEVQEVKRYLKAVTGEDIALDDLYLTADGKIGGLPDKVGNMINNTKNNAKIDRIRDMLRDIIQNISISSNIGTPDFTSEFQFRNGVFSIADSGFNIDVNALDKKMTPHYSGNMYSDMYEYKFKKVL